jgi:BirA family biotin operon repressor/biotin-[acetyl-CoA-carboxylase] ligase
MHTDPPTAGALTPPAVEPLLRGRFGRSYVYRDRCESTQRLLDRALGEGAVAVCDEQTGGRGRLGRPWIAPPGAAVLCSVLLEPPAGRAIAQLSLVAGVAVAETVEAATSLPAGIKWPNDVLLGGRKVAGVLAEAGDGAVVLGIGLNVNQPEAELPGEGSVPAGSLFTADGVTRERAPILADLLLRLESAYVRWRERGLEAVHEGLAARDLLRGRRLRVEGESARAIGVDRLGRLEIEVAGERRLVESGEVLLED